MAQVLEAEIELEEGGEVNLKTQFQTEKLQICQFVELLRRQCEFAGVIRSVEMLASLLLSERRMQALELTIPACQVKESFVCNDVSKRYVSTCCGVYLYVKKFCCQLDSLKKS